MPLAHQISTSYRLTSFGYTVGGPKIKVGAADLPRRPLADKFLHGAIVPANAYQRTKFQLPSSISFGDMEGSQNQKNGAADVPRRPLADKFLHGALVLVNTIVLYASDGKGLLPYAYVSENIRSSGNKALIITIIIHKMYACTIDDHKVLPIRGASRCTIQIHVYLARRRRIDVERK